MTNRERALAVLRYEDYDRLPIVHFGYWGETLLKWWQEGHLTEEEARGLRDGNALDRQVAAKVGFDFNWQTMFGANSGLKPNFGWKVVKEFPNGLQHVLNSAGVITVQNKNAQGIPAEIDHLLKDLFRSHVAILDAL